MPLPWAGPLVVRVPAAAAHGATSAAAESAIVALSRRYPHYGHRRIHALVERQGHRCARSTVQRVWRQEGLRVTGPSQRPKCPPWPEARIGSEGLYDAWCLDSLFEVTTAGTTIKFLTIADEGSHHCIDYRRQPVNGGRGSDLGSADGDRGARGAAAPAVRQRG